jgi:hypothetical protein
MLCLAHDKSLSGPTFLLAFLHRVRLCTTTAVETTPLNILTQISLHLTIKHSTLYVYVDKFYTQQYR